MQIFRGALYKKKEEGSSRRVSIAQPVDQKWSATTTSIVHVVHLLPEVDPVNGMTTLTASCLSDRSVLKPVDCVYHEVPYTSVEESRMSVAFKVRTKADMFLLSYILHSPSTRTGTFKFSKHGKSYD